MTALGLYLHVPFCARRCDYCDFYVVAGRSADHDRFGAVMEEEIRAAGESLAAEERRADTIYIGGGTPSILDPSWIGRLIAACRESFDLSGAAEITIEVNPEGIDEARVEGWLRAGVNRLSIGIQSLDDEALRQRGRLHTGAQGLDAITLARRCGFDNISADLIAGLPDPPSPYGRPGSNGSRRLASRFAEGVRAVLGRRPDHLSIYLFETDKETALMRAVRDRRETLPDDDEVARAHGAASEAASEAGYEHYEIANFCLPGRRSRHNMKYWTGDPYLGFGPAAHSFFRGRRFSTPRDLDAYLAGARRATGGGTSAGEYTLKDAESAAREALVLNLRLLEGVDLDAFDRKWGIDSRSWVRRELADVIGAGLVRLENATLRLTPKGILLANEVFAALAR